MADSKSSAQLCVHTDSLQLTQYKPACNLAHQEFYSLDEVNITHRHLFLSSPQFPSSPFSSPFSGEKHNKEELPVAIESRDDEEDGYQTPTSPSHRIPAIMNCPPTPKKPADMSQTRKRVGRSFCWIDSSDLELSFSLRVDGTRTRNKKVRREEETPKIC